MTHQLYGPKKNTTFTFYLALVAQASPTIDNFDTPPTIAVGDFKVSIDGAASANLTNLPVESPVGSGMVQFVLTAAEMNGDAISVIGHDVAGAEWKDVAQVIYTRAATINDLPLAVDYSTARAAKLDHLDVDVSTRAPSTELRRNTATAGGPTTITLDAGASAIDGFYDGQLIVLISGTGLGQALHVTAYNGTTKVATVDAGWFTIPDATTVFAILPEDLAAQFLDAAVSSRADGAHFTNARGDLLDNLNVPVSSRADGASYTGPRAANLDFLDALISSRAAGIDYNSTRAAKLDFLDATISSRADASVFTPGRATKLDFLDAAVSSRAAPGAAMALVANAVDSGQITAATANKLADFILRRAYASARVSANGDAVTFHSLLGAIAKLVNDLTISGSSLLVSHENSSPFGSQTITTTPGAAPITGLATN